MDEDIMTLPVVALKNLTILPGMSVNFDVARKKSIAAIEYAMSGNQQVFLTAQLDPEAKNPGLKDLYSIGTIAIVRQYVKTPNGMIRVSVEGKERGSLNALTGNGAFLSGQIVRRKRTGAEEISPVDHEAMRRVLMENLLHYAQMIGQQPVLEYCQEVSSLDTLEAMLDDIACKLPWQFQERQQMLEADTVRAEFDAVNKALLTNAEVVRLRREFEESVKNTIDKNQRDYVLREQLNVIRNELGDNTESEADELRDKVKALCADDSVKERLNKEISRFEEMPPGSQDGNVLRTYVETLLELPWNKMTQDNKDLGHAKEILEKDHYGLEQVKNRVLESLAVRILTDKGNGSIICLVGPPGTGKTSIAQSIARALGKKYVRISLGGVRDEAEIRGHRKTYVGAMPGRIVEGLSDAGVSNPLMLLDEIDKVSSDYKGDTGSALLEVLDSEQNSHFRDHYVEIPIDLSNVLFIATANTTQTIPKPLLDRMDIIEVSSYTENEKFHIGKDYLIPKQIRLNGLKKGMLTISDEALRKIIHNYTAEAGVRNLERRIGDICRKTAREVLENKKTAVRVNSGNLEKYLGKERVPEEEHNHEDQVGIVTGLAWTSVGGVTLQIEVNVMPGKGGLIMTGQMGDVMKESAQIALTWVRSVAVRYGAEEDFFEKHDIHIHIPEGAVPKDGPSAGIAMSTAMLSAVSGRKVSGTVAMTGEVTLRGNVLMIGGLKEKLLAANQAGMKKVLVPDRNRPDVAELAKEITRGMEIVYVKSMEEVIRQAFTGGEEGR